MTAKALGKPAPLGRGLSALFGDSDASYQARPAVAAIVGGDKVEKASGAPLTVPITWIQPGAFQPRRAFDDDALKELADSIRKRGILQPLLVRALPDGKDCYELIAGERRWRAAQLAGLHNVPVVVRSMTDLEVMEAGLIENVQRQDLSPLEEAEGYRRLVEEFKHSLDELARVIGKSRPHIANMMRLLTLPEAVKKRITSGELTMGHARTIITAKNPEALAEEIIKKGLSVRQAEALARAESEGRYARKPAREPVIVDSNTLALEKELEGLFGLKTKIETKGSAGTLTLHYSDLDQLDGILQRLRTSGRG